MDQSINQYAHLYSAKIDNLIACPHWRQKLPKTATNCSRSYSPESCPKRRQIVARNGNKSETATFVAVLLPFLATICRRFRQLLSPVWTGYKMSSNEHSVSALEQASFQLFAESVKTHSSSAQFCRQSVPRHRAAHSERATTKNSSCSPTVQSAAD